MARDDAVGLFWQDHPAEKGKGGKARAAKPKAEPPPPFWLEPGYLPPPDQVAISDPDPLTDDDLANGREPLVYDVESFPNLFCVVFLGLVSRRAWVYVHGRDNPAKLKWVAENRNLVAFAGIQYDLPMVSAAALTPYDAAELWRMSMQIVGGVSRYRLMRDARVRGTCRQHGGHQRRGPPVRGSQGVRGAPALPADTGSPVPARDGADPGTGGGRRALLCQRLRVHRGICTTP